LLKSSSWISTSRGHTFLPKRRSSTRTQSPSLFSRDNSLVSVSRLAVVANNLHATNHGANSKETKNFSANDANLCELLSIDVADGLEDGLRIVGAEARKEC
jgi:hypothetical protein